MILLCFVSDSLCHIGSVNFTDDFEMRVLLIRRLLRLVRRCVIGECIHHSGIMVYYWRGFLPYWYCGVLLVIAYIIVVL